MMLAAALTGLAALFLPDAVAFSGLLIYLTIKIIYFILMSRYLSCC